MTIRRAFARLSFLLALASAPLLAVAGNPKATMVAPSFDGPTQIAFSTDQVSNGPICRWARIACPTAM